LGAETIEFYEGVVPDVVIQYFESHLPNNLTTKFIKKKLPEQPDRMLIESSINEEKRLGEKVEDSLLAQDIQEVIENVDYTEVAQFLQEALEIKK
jgi:hypothetical protein